MLDKREFRSCLYSMGEERGKKEIDEILNKLGNGDVNNVKITYDGHSHTDSHTYTRAFTHQGTRSS